MPSDLISSLNPTQRQAITSTGSLLIRAGPGTGKTKTLVARIVYLIKHHHCPPSDILAITFTRKAAAEMRSRLFRQLPRASLPPVHTFHSLARELLSPFYPDLRLIDDRLRQFFIRQLQTSFPRFRHTPILDLGYRLSQVKNSTYSDPAFLPFYEAYRRLLADHKLIDFDDLLCLFFLCPIPNFPILNIC